MKIFLDSVNLPDIAKYKDFIDGVTTNPSLMSKSDISFEQTVQEICKIVDDNVSVEVASMDLDGMKKEGDKILSIHQGVVVKLPITLEGLQACQYFASRGARVNMTLCFTPTQALLAARCGASYVSPFIGRLDDIGADGSQLIEDIRIIYDNYEYETEILAASVRSLEHIKLSMISGADAITMSATLLEQMMKHKLTDLGLQQFTNDWQKSGQKI